MHYYLLCFCCYYFDFGFDYCFDDDSEINGKLTNGFFFVCVTSQTYSAAVKSVLPVLMSAVRVSPPSNGPPHDGKVIGKDLVTYTYNQAIISTYTYQYMN